VAIRDPGPLRRGRAIRWIEEPLSPRVRQSRSRDFGVSDGTGQAATDLPLERTSTSQLDAGRL